MRGRRGERKGRVKEKRRGGGRGRGKRGEDEGRGEREKRRGERESVRENRKVDRGSVTGRVEYRGRLCGRRVE